MATLYSACFDKNTDTTVAQIGTFRLEGVKTGDEVNGRPVSKFFVESALLFGTNAALKLGFVKGSDARKFYVEWRYPGMQEVLRGLLDFTTGEFHTNAKNNLAYQTFGMVGIGAALVAQSQGFATEWINFITALQEKASEAVTPASMSAIAVELGEALTVAAPDQNPDKWVLRWNEAMPSSEVEADLRDNFVRIDDFVAMTESFAGAGVVEKTRFQGPQLEVVRNLLRRRKHHVLLGPPGVGKTVSAFEALALEGFKTAGVDYQLFTGHDEVKSADFLGAYQPSGNPDRPYIWVNGCLVRAMTANGGRGQPILVEEFTRMPTRAQNMFISVLSDGYCVLNEKPSMDGQAEIVKAGPDFVLIADMNVDPAADDIELYGAAFSSRVRKVEYTYPSQVALLQILMHDVPSLAPLARAGIAGTYNAVMGRWKGAEVPQPISPRACVQWAEEIVALTPDKKRVESGVLRQIAWQGAELTWLRDVAGTDESVRKTLKADVEAQFRKAKV